MIDQYTRFPQLISACWLDLDSDQQNLDDSMHGHAPHTECMPPVLIVQLPTRQGTVFLYSMMQKLPPPLV